MHFIKWLIVYLCIGWMFYGAFVDEDGEPPFYFILIWPAWIMCMIGSVLMWLMFKFGEKISKFVIKRHRKIHKKVNERRKTK